MSHWKAALLKLLPRRALTRAFGDRWRVPLVRFASSPFVYALPGETVVLAGCYKLETVRKHRQAVGVAGRVIAIEANRESVRQLEAAMRTDPVLRNADNVSLVAKGVWDRQGQTVFVTSEDDGRDYDRVNDECLDGLETGRGQISREEVIEVDTIDNILADLDVEQVDYVVLTVNNCELPALRGLSQTMARNPQLRLYIHSVSPDPLHQVESALADAGFRMRVKPVNRGSRLHRIYAFGHASCHPRAYAPTNTRAS
jgi:FkbM family methyltransferase